MEANCGQMLKNFTSKKKKEKKKKEKKKKRKEKKRKVFSTQTALNPKLDRVQFPILDENM